MNTRTDYVYVMLGFAAGVVLVAKAQPLVPR
jgi:hypothetical protein